MGGQQYKTNGNHLALQRNTAERQRGRPPCIDPALPEGEHSTDDARPSTDRVQRRQRLIIRAGCILNSSTLIDSGQ